MFGRNRKLAGLTLAAVWTAGCAHSDFRVRSPYQGGRSTRDDAAMADAQLAESPSILPQTHFAAAKLFESQGMPNKAITQYRKAIAVNHSYVEAHERLGLLLSRIGRHEEASRTLRGAVALRPKDARLRNNLGFELLVLGDAGGAEAAFQEAVRLDPGFARANVNLGIAQSRLGRFDEALESFRTVLPEPDAYYNLALMYRGEGNPHAAVEALQHVLTIEPAFAAAKKQLEQLASQVAVMPAAETLTQTEPATVPPSLAAPARAAMAVEDRGADVAVASASKPSIAVVARSAEPVNEPAVPAPLPNSATSDSKVEVGTSESRPSVASIAARPEPIAESVVPATDVVRSDDARETTDRPAWMSGAANVTLKSAWEDAGVVLAGAAERPALAAGDAVGCPPAVDETRKAAPTEAPARVNREPEIARMFGRRVEASGFQTDRPDVADQIEVLQNEFRCLPPSAVETVVTRGGRASRPAEAVASVTNESEAARVADSAWSQALGFERDVAPISVADVSIASTDGVAVVLEDPCDEALMIEYVPACDPIGVMGEFAALDPAEPIVYVEEPAGVIAFSLADFSQLADASVFEIAANTCLAATDTLLAEIVVTGAQTVAEEPIACVNQAAVIRDLEEQLGLVRAEIACLEEQEMERTASVEVAAVKRSDVRLVAEHESVPNGDTKTAAPQDRKNTNAASAAEPPLKATGRAPIVKPRPKKITQSSPRAREFRKRQALEHHRQPND